MRITSPPVYILDLQLEKKVQSNIKEGARVHLQLLEIGVNWNGQLTLIFSFLLNGKYIITSIFDWMVESNVNILIYLKQQSMIVYK